MGRPSSALLRPLLLLSAAAATTVRDFAPSCSRSLEAPLTRFWGSRPHPDLSMVAKRDFWRVDDANLAILPKWIPLSSSSNTTIPFVDTHVAVRFLGGVSNFTAATATDCTDQPGPARPTGVDVPGLWCDLVVRNVTTGALRSRFDLVQSRLGRFVDMGIDVMIVLDNVPWAFVRNRTEGPCQTFGCQYLPPDDPAEFASWVGELAEYTKKAFGSAYASRIRWRLGTEANGPRWSSHGEYFQRYWDSYRLTGQALRKAFGGGTLGGQFGASNWLEVVSHSGNLTRNGSDWFAYNFYSNVGGVDEGIVPLDFVSVSHYGGGRKNTPPGPQNNFPEPDWVQRTPGGAAGDEMELSAMRALAKRPQASLEVQEWSILANEDGQGTWEPSSLGTAWTAASATSWICAGADRIFHWETGTTLRNSTGDGRLVNFYEQWPWNMALLELFLGGRATFSTFSRRERPRVGADQVAVIESQFGGQFGGQFGDQFGGNADQTRYMALVSGVASTRKGSWTTRVTLKTDAFKVSGAGVAGKAATLQVQQWRMNASFSVVETIVRELSGTNGTLQHDDGLPYDTGRLLTPAGRKYAESLENLDRYWAMHAQTFQPGPFEGTWRTGEDGTTTFEMDVASSSVTVLSARLVSDEM